MIYSLVAQLSPSFRSGLTITARVYTGSTLTATVAMTELPPGSARYVGSFPVPLAAAKYDWSAVDAGGNGVWTGERFQSDAAGNVIDTVALISQLTADLAKVPKVGKQVRWRNVNTGPGYDTIAMEEPV